MYIYLGKIMGIDGIDEILLWATSKLKTESTEAASIQNSRLCRLF